MINFYFFYFSTYLLIILISFVISFIVFYCTAKKAEYNRIDIIYIFVINILGFAIGSKFFYLIDVSKAITISNFLNSGYSFIGGIIGSILFVYMYCRKYNLNFVDWAIYFIIIYPLIYSISKLACFTNGCCSCIVPNFPLQLLESLLMFILFVYLYKTYKNKHYYIFISKFLILLGVIRFIVDYFRYKRNILLLNLTLSQLICGISIILGLIILVKKCSLKSLYSKNENLFHSWIDNIMEKS